MFLSVAKSSRLLIVSLLSKLPTGFDGFEIITPRTLRPRFFACLNARSRAVVPKLKLSALRHGTGIISTPVRHWTALSSLQIVFRNFLVYIQNMENLPSIEFH